jgi:hypothetical protein
MGSIMGSQKIMGSDYGSNISEAYSSSFFSLPFFLFDFDANIFLILLQIFNLTSSFF